MVGNIGLKSICYETEQRELITNLGNLYSIILPIMQLIKPKSGLLVNRIIAKGTKRIT